MPRYFFDIQDGHRLADPAGMIFKNDADAIAKAKVFAIQVSLDTPRVDPSRYVSLLNDARDEIFQVDVIQNLTALINASACA